MITTPSATAAAILDAAQRMTQEFGYNGLSFRDVAAAVGIKSASVHYHFPSKERLAAAVARRYTDGIIARLDALDESGVDAARAFSLYVAGIRKTLEQDGRMCLCGMLAAETGAIPEAVRAEVRRFVELNTRWIARALGRITGDPVESAPIRGRAMAILAALEGAMLIARGTGDIASFDAMAAEFTRSGLIPG